MTAKVSKNNDALEVNKYEIEKRLKHNLVEDRVQLKRKQFNEEKEEWLITYADAITLIMSFFVFLFSISEIKEEKFDTINQSISENLLKKTPVIKPNPFLGLHNKLNSILDDHHINLNSAMEMTHNYIKIALPGELFFKSASSELGDKSKALISELAIQVLKVFIDEGVPLNKLKAIGYADTHPIVDNRNAYGAPIIENQRLNRRVEIRVSKDLTQ
jgi:chemotaxis protein MotB